MFKALQIKRYSTYLSATSHHVPGAVGRLDDNYNQDEKTHLKTLNDKLVLIQDGVRSEPVK